MDVAGGAEYMTALIANILRDVGYSVTLVSGTDVDRRSFAALTGINLSNDIEVVSVPRFLTRLINPNKKSGIALLTMYRSRLLRKLVVRQRPDIVIVDDEVFQKLEDVRNSYGHLINYVHFPYDNVLNIHELDKVRARNAGILSKLAFEAFAKLARAHIISRNFSDLVIANSHYTRIACMRAWDREDVSVLYPPVSVNKYSNSASKENICIVLGRIAPDKNIEMALEAFKSPELARYRLIVTGLVIPQYRAYADRIMASSKSHDNISFIVNPERSRLQEILSSAKILLHTRKGEHFGLAIVEGMASGCIPVVHSSGGPVEIIDSGKFGFAFSSDNDLPSTLLKAFAAGQEMHQRVMERAKAFDTSSFRQCLVDQLSTLQTQRLEIEHR
jgi:glycosyltransferase involved in cell wall biosynthesis